MMEEPRPQARAALLASNSEMQTALVGSEMGLLDDLLDLAEQLHRNLSQHALACTPLAKACFALVRGLRLASRGRFIIAC